MDSIVWLASLGGAHSQGLYKYLRDRSFDVKEWDPVVWSQHSAGAIQQGVLVVDIENPDEATSDPCRFAAVGLPHFFLLPAHSGLDRWLSRCRIDNFAIKPVSLETVEEYVRVLARRSSRSSFGIDSEDTVLSKPDSPVRREAGTAGGQAPVVIDEDLKSVRVGERTIRLTPKEFDLLCLLASRPGHVFSTDEIVARVWKGKKRATSLDVQQYIHHLRKKVEHDPRSPRWIKNVKGFGYLLEYADTA